MKTVSQEEFTELLHKLEAVNLIDLEVIIDSVFLIDLDKISPDVTFDRINFKGYSIKFLKGGENSINGPLLRFNNCKFLNSIMFDNATIHELNFDKCIFENDKSLAIRRCSIRDLIIKDMELFGLEFLIKKSTIKYADFEKIRIHNGTFKIWNCDFPDFFAITQSSIKHINFSHNQYQTYFDFLSNKPLSSNSTQSYRYCEFSQSSFSESQFSPNTDFIECNFHKTVKLSNLKGQNTQLKFLNCVFEKYVQFNNSIFENLHFENIKFNDIVSFQEAVVQKIEIDKTIFEKSAIFDDFKILHKRDCNRRTLRNIKQQLQKSDDKIEYNRFRSYELAAYYKELKWSGNFKDKFILGATWLSTGFEHSWRRAAIFALGFGLFWYSILYVLEFYVFLNLNGNDNFWPGAFRFFLVTDFFSPFLDRQYLNTGYSWTILIIGKIFIAFGIYEMIQAFRKFKA